MDAEYLENQKKYSKVLIYINTSIESLLVLSRVSHHPYSDIISFQR